MDALLSPLRVLTEELQQLINAGNTTQPEILNLFQSLREFPQSGHQHYLPTSCLVRRPIVTIALDQTGTCSKRVFENTTFGINVKIEQDSDCRTGAVAYHAHVDLVDKDGQDKSNLVQFSLNDLRLELGPWCLELRASHSSQNRAQVSSKKRTVATLRFALAFKPYPFASTRRAAF
eukprot:c20713_g3_i2.p1 GENE.c20713_g3_i2~~c20713_g3_i2.p1  ORF type:complete len:176 (+),score=28.70 c20713_g3_i2:143-670(+)